MKRLLFIVDRRPASRRQARERIDQVLAFAFDPPSSYTGEPAAEIHGHGGPHVLDRLLSAAIGAGAAPAPPGEFTRRAFLSGRIDLIQAEAVALIPDGATVMIGGFGGSGAPIELIHALIDHGAKNLTVINTTVVLTAPGETVSAPVYGACVHRHKGGLTEGIADVGALFVQDMFAGRVGRFESLAAGPRAAFRRYYLDRREGFWLIPGYAPSAGFLLELLARHAPASPATRARGSRTLPAHRRRTAARRGRSPTCPWT